MNYGSMVLGCLLSVSGLHAAELPAVSPDVRERLAFTWTNEAQRLDAGNRVIYYQGNLKRDAVPGAASRVTLTGDILVIENDSVIAASEVSFLEDGIGKMTVTGPSKLVFGTKDAFVRSRVKELTAKR